MSRISKWLVGIIAAFIVLTVLVSLSLERSPVGFVWHGRLADGADIILEWRSREQYFSISGLGMDRAWSQVLVSDDKDGKWVTIQISESVLDKDKDAYVEKNLGKIVWKDQGDEISDFEIQIIGRNHEKVRLEKVGSIFQRTSSRGLSWVRLGTSFQLTGAEFSASWPRLDSGKWEKDPIVMKRIEGYVDRSEALTLEDGWEITWLYLKELTFYMSPTTCEEFVHIHACSPDFLSLRVNSSGYSSGAAHGYYGTFGFNFVHDEHGATREILLRDFFDSEKWPKEAEATMSLCRESLKLQEASNAEEISTLHSSDEYNRPSNFTLEKEGIRFWFPPYAAGSYAEGEFSVFIPWEKMRLLIPENSILRRIIPLTEEFKSEI